MINNFETISTAITIEENDIRNNEINNAINVEISAIQGINEIKFENRQIKYILLFIVLLIISLAISLFLNLM
jgi:hypothetical protein